LGSQNAYFNFEEAVTFYIKESNGKMKRLFEQLNQITNQSAFEKIKQTCKERVDIFSNKPNFYWSQYKSSKIMVNGAIATQTSAESSGERFALM
jgi:hypothetical protein